jgi:lysophospholipase L1-like esterase
VAGFTAAPASAARTGPVYIALGDSYAAGTGGGEYKAPPRGLPAECRQTAAAYPAVRGAAQPGCFGAMTTDVIDVAKLYASDLATASVITVTVGGNDVDTGQTAVACAVSASAAGCGSALYNSLEPSRTGRRKPGSC